jgi:GTP cyclohydrolase II
MSTANETTTALAAPHPEMLAAERAIDEARSGRPLLVEDGAGATLYAPIETMGAHAVAMLTEAARGELSVLVSPQRAAALGAPVAEAAGAVVLAVAETAAVDTAVRIAAGGSASAAAAARSCEIRLGDHNDRAVIALLKTAWLLPAALRTPLEARVDPASAAARAVLGAPGVLHRVSADALIALPARTGSEVMLVSEARIPLKDAPDVRFVCFRSTIGSREHLALVIGDPVVDPGVAVRLHSACLTGDVFGSMRCDCGDQLQQSVASLRALGGGVLLYLSQEGRGIGLSNKLRAYALQDRGQDTIDADLQLGFTSDERHYGVAAAMLRRLGYLRIRLMTNNPDKLEALREGGITVVERLPLLACITPQNRRYMHAKRTRARHLLDPEDAGG